MFLENAIDSQRVLYIKRRLVSPWRRGVPGGRATTKLLPVDLGANLSYVKPDQPLVSLMDGVIRRQASALPSLPILKPF